MSGLESSGGGQGNGTPPGSWLIEARELRGWDHEDVCEMLKLSLRFVLALEHNNFDQLPARTFARGYLRSYARLLDLPLDSVLARYDEMAASSTSGTSGLSTGTLPTKDESRVRQQKRKAERDSSATTPASKAPSRSTDGDRNDDQSKTDSAGGERRPVEQAAAAPHNAKANIASRFRATAGKTISKKAASAVMSATDSRIRRTWVLGGGAALIALALVGTWLWSASDTPATVVSAPAPAPAGASSVQQNATITLPKSSASPELATTNNAAVADGSTDDAVDASEGAADAAAAAIATVAPADDDRVEEPGAAAAPEAAAVTASRPADAGAGFVVTFTGDCWVEAYDRDERRLFLGMRTAGQTLRLTGAEPIRVLLGSAAVVAVTRDGVAVDLAPHTRNNVVRMALGDNRQALPDAGGTL